MPATACTTRRPTSPTPQELGNNSPAIDYWAFNNNTYASNGFHYVSDGFVHTPAPGPRTLKQWFNTADFANVGSNWNTLPNSTATAPVSGRNTLQGPGTKNVDFSVFKNIPLHEALNLQLRSEFFNLFNTPQFNNPNSTVGTGFGTVSSAGSPTTIQRISREVQLAAKVTF